MHIFIKVSLLLGFIYGSQAGCPLGWASNGDRCYFISTYMYDFELARTVCKNHNGDLMVINNAEEKAFVEKLIRGRGHDLWFGLWEDPNQPGSNVFKWVDNSNPGPDDPEISNWACEQRPGAGCDETEIVGPCGYYDYVTMKWKNHPCEERKIFMCRRNNNVVDYCDIEGGWVQYMNRCYKMMSDKRNWNDANNQCKNNGGQLAVLKEQSRIDASRDIHTCIDYSTGVWIGLSDTTSATEQTLNWVDGSASTSGQTYWAEGQPHYGSNHGSNCVAAYAVDESKWRINTCGSSNRYLCERDYGTCTAPWVRYDNTGYCYLVVTAEGQKLTYLDAKAACAAYGSKAMLMKITQQSEQNALKSIWRNSLNGTGINNIRIGISDQQTDNVFRWVDNTNIGYQQWNETHKVMVTDRMDCGYVPVPDNPNARWGSDYCFDKMSYICQIDIHQSPNTFSQPQMLPPQPHDDLACPDGWEMYKSDCYLFSDQTRMYAEAKALCEEQNADIITVRNAEEQSFLSYRLRDWSWLGLVYSENRWVWDGTTSQPGFKNWAPDGRDEQDEWPCSRLMNNPPGQWTCNACDDQKRFVICRKPATHTGTEASTSVTPTVPSHPECGSGWAYDMNSQACIGVRGGVSVSWEEANRRCVEEESAHLVSVSHPTQQTFINALLAAQVGGASRYWIGLNDRDLEKGWEWTDGSPVAYFNWADGEPNYSDEQEWCVEMIVSKDNGWNDQFCTKNIDGYICKKPAQSAVTTTTTAPEVTDPVTPSPTCENPEAMVSGNMYIQDQYLIASSQAEGREAWRARMNSDKSWEAADMNTNQFIEAYFPFPRMVKQVKLAGAKDKEAFVRSFKVLYRLEHGQRWHYVRATDGQEMVFEGNVLENKDAGVVRDFPEAVYAVGVRILPQTWNNSIAVRFDVHGCHWDGAICPAWDSISGETRVIDDRITASGGKEGIPATEVRYSKNGWQASEPYNTDQWVQFEFDCHMRIIEIGIKGHKNENRYVEKFTVKLFNPNSPQTDKWEDYQEPYGTVKSFTGNQNNVDEVRIALKSEVYASIVRIIPQQHSGGKSMRIEMKACPPGCHNKWLISGEQHSLEDSALTASSSYDSFHGPPRSRLFTEAKDGYKGAWSAQQNNKEQWIQVDVGYEVSMKGVVMQGRQDQDQWVKRYHVRYSRDGSSWRDVTWDGSNITTFTAYFNRNQLRTNWFPYAHTARYLRIYPIEWQKHISMRFDVQGCPGPYSYQDVGCYADDRNDRDLPYAGLQDVSGGMTHEICVTHCHNLGYLYAATQYSYECFCGNSYGKHGISSLCNRGCTGDPTQVCGGYLANWVQTTGLSPKSKRCADGWTEYNKRCYWVDGSNTYTWGESEYQCKQRGGHLAAIHSMAVNNFIQTSMLQGKNAWIGLHALEENFVFEWSNYDAVVFTNWNRREPNRAQSTEDCVEMIQSSGRWNDDPCERADNSYVCEKAKEELEPAPTPTPDPGCGQGWVSFRWKCYTFLTNGNDWSRHKDNCQGWGEGSYLARIRDNQEQAFLASVVADKGGKFWTDLNDRDNPGSYVFTNGGSPSYTHWGIGQPDQPGSASCVAMSDDDNALWFDEDCGTLYGAICEKLSTTETQPPTEVTPPASGGCAPSWVEYGGYCYLIKKETGNHQVTWDEARVYCTNAGADLASFHSQEENDFFWKLYLSDDTKNYWTGLSRATSEESFKWSDGSELGYINWKTDNPGTGKNQNCVHMSYAEGKWANVACDNTRSWICKIPQGESVATMSTLAPPTPASDGSCAPDGDKWKFYNERCYYFGTAKQTWYDAASFCRENGGYLASIHDADTNYFIMGQVRGYNSYINWIGLNNIEGTEGWTDGTPLDYANWASGQPDDEQGTKMCGAYGSNAEHYGKWLHRHCTEKAHYVCAKVKGASPEPTELPTPKPGGCPEGYIAYRDKCFKFVDEAVTWHVARNRCYEENKPYSLASIANRYEQAFLTSQLINHEHTHWIGMTYNPESSEFAWTDNTDIQYTNWSPNEPNGNEDEPCVEMLYGEHKAGHWNDLICEATMGYICMTFKDPSLPDPPKHEFCPEYGDHYEEDYIKFDDDCYKAATGSMRTWQEGEEHCKEDEGTYGHLTSISNVYEQAFLESIFLDIRPDINIGDLAWIGLTDRDQEGRFHWSDKRTVTYTNWGENEPDQPGGGCAYFRFSDGKWVDGPCEETGMSLCKISKKDDPYTRPPSGSCPGSERGRDWLEYGNSCYMFIEEGGTFADARHECSMMGSELVSIHSMDENTFIQDHILMPHYKQYWWLGMTRTPSGRFQWLDGSQVDFLRWSSGEPSDKNGTMGEDCIDFNSVTASWNDITCSPVNGIICKRARDIATPSTTPAPDFPTDVTVPPSSTLVTPRSTPPTTDPPTQPPPNTPSSTQPPKVEDPDENEPLSAGATVGIVFAVLALVLLAAVIGLVVYRRQQWQKYASSEAGLVNPSYGTSEVPGEDILNPGDSTA